MELTMVNHVRCVRERCCTAVSLLLLQELGVKSKTHMKSILLDMKKNKEVKLQAIPVEKTADDSSLKQGGTKKKKKRKGDYTPPPTDKLFVYSLPQ